MSKDLLERLYWTCSDINGMNNNGLSAFYELTEEVKRADTCFSKQLYATDLPQEAKMLLEDTACSLSDAMEKQGFINGFRLGMKLAREVYGGDAG